MADAKVVEDLRTRSSETYDEVVRLNTRIAEAIIEGADPTALRSLRRRLQEEADDLGHAALLLGSRLRAARRGSCG